MTRGLAAMLVILAAASAFADGEATYSTQVIGAGTFTLTQPRAVRTGPDGSVYLIEGDTDWATMRRIAPDLGSSQRFSAKVVTPDNAPAKWFHPAGLHATPSGDLLVADTGRRRILRLDAAGQFKAVVVAPGAPANLEGPTDAVELPSGEIVVCDSASSRILLFGADGTLKRVIAAPGTDSDEVNHPFSLALGRDGGLWVVDTLNRRLVRRGADMVVARVIRPQATDGPLLAWPSYMDIDRSGNILVADDGRSCVFKLTPTGEVVARLGMRPGERGPFSRVSGVAAMPDGTVLASDSARGVLVRFAAGGAILGEMGWSHFRGQGGWPQSFGIDASGGFFFVTSRYGSQAKYYGPDGVQRAEFAGEGVEPGKLLRARAAAVGPDGCLYVADSEQHRVTVFKSDGALVRVFGRAGSGPSDVRYPRAVTVAPDGRVFVGDAGNQRVQAFSSDGRFLATFARGVNPYALDVDGAGRVAVYDDADDVAIVFGADGREAWRASLRVVQDFGGMMLMPDGALWVLERRGGIVRSFAEGRESAETVLREPRAAWRGSLVRGPGGRAFIASGDGIYPIESGKAGALVEARLPAVPGRLMQPESLALVWGDELAVLESATGAVQVFGRDGTFRRVMELTPRLSGLVRIAADASGNLLALSRLDGAIWRVTKDGRATRLVQSDSLREASAFSMCLDGSAWVHHEWGGGLVRVGPDGKDVARAGGGRGRHWGLGVCALADGGVIVTEKGSGKMACYGPDGALRWTFDAEALGEAGRLKSVAAAHVDAAGNLLVLGGDWSGLCAYSADHTFVESIKPDAAIGSLGSPSDFAVDSDGSIFIADTSNNRIVKLAKRNTSGK